MLNIKAICAFASLCGLSVYIMLTPLFAAEEPAKAEKRFLLSKQNDQQLRLEKSGKWRIKKNVDGVNFVDRDTSPKKGSKIVDCPKNYGDVCTSS